MAINKEEVRAELAIGILIQGYGTAAEVESAIAEQTERIMRIIEREERKG